MNEPSRNSELFIEALTVAKIYQEAEKKATQPISIDGACTITGLAKQSIYNYASQGKIPFHKSAGRKKIYFYEKELIDWMAGLNVKEETNV